MELHKALRNIIQTEGCEIIKDLRIINILDDFNAYKDIPASKYILRAIIADGYSSKILSMKVWDNQTEALIQKFTTTTGFVVSSVDLIFQSIAYGLGFKNEVPNYNITININNHVQPYGNSNTMQNLDFFGFKLGCSLKQCISHFNTPTTSSYVSDKDCVCFRNSFLGFDWCSYKVYTTPKTKLVYNITVQLKYTDSIDILRNNYKTIMSVYREKYGEPQDYFDIDVKTNRVPFSYKGESSRFCLQNGTIVIEIYQGIISIKYTDYKTLMNNI